MDHQVLDETEQQPHHDGIHTFQDQILSILPIPSAILSLVGSSVILYMAFSTRRERKWTTYTRLLIGLSMCDIVSSVSLGLAAFMRRPQSGRVWAFGNDATCTAAGTLIQFSYSNCFFNAMLSFYFMATVRLGVKNAVIAKWFEPMMHFVSIGYPLVTSLVGAYFGMYSETATGMGCWVNDYPRGCGDGPDKPKCKSGYIGYLYHGLPYIFAAAALLINNFIIWWFVQKQRRPILNTTPQQTPAISSFFHWMSSSESMSDRNMSVDREGSSLDDRSLDRSFIADTAGRSNKAENCTSNGCISPATNIKRDQSSNDPNERAVNADQMRRLQLVSSQAFLFVLSYVMCNTWMGLLAIIEGMTEEEDEPKLMKNIYWLMVVNVIFAPLQGFFNMLVYMRPKYIKARHQFPKETRAWAFRRAVIGDGVRPEQRRLRRPIETKVQIETTSRTVQGTCPLANISDSQEEQSSGNNSNHITTSSSSQHQLPLPKSRMAISTLTASIGDFEDGNENNEPHERTKGAFDSSSSSFPRFEFHSSLDDHIGRGLEAISELTESLFDPIVRVVPTDDESSRSSDNSGRLNSSERRWSSTNLIRSSDRTTGPSSSHASNNEYRKDDVALQSSLRLTAPRRMDSDIDSIVDDEVKEDDVESEEEEEVEYTLDMPVSMPIRRLSHDKSLNSGSFHSYNSSISSSCSLISSEFGEFEDDCEEAKMKDEESV